MKELEKISQRLTDRINSELIRVGLLFRIYSRYKALESVESKISRKNYTSGGKNLQDSIGIRVNLYFVDDLPVVVNLIKRIFKLNNEVIDIYNHETFKPTRTNLVFNIPENEIKEFSAVIKQYDKPIAETFEVQVRSVLSEGWHEVEHDLRYKCQKEWEQHLDLSRILNGIYASLETGEWSMLQLFDELAYRNYQKKEWESMLRNKLRLRFKLRPLDKKIIKIMMEHNDVAKQLFKLDRNAIIKRLSESKIAYPITYDNMIYILNHLYIRDFYIKNLTPDVMLEDLNTIYGGDVEKLTVKF